MCHTLLCILDSMLLCSKQDEQKQSADDASDSVSEHWQRGCAAEMIMFHFLCCSAAIESTHYAVYGDRRK